VFERNYYGTGKPLKRKKGGLKASKQIQILDFPNIEAFVFRKRDFKSLSVTKSYVSTAGYGFFASWRKHVTRAKKPPFRPW